MVKFIIQKCLNNLIVSILKDANGCDLGINCPVKAGDALSESVTLPILNEYPKINLFVKWQVMDDQNKQMICFIFPVSIQ